ncbi:hypothetical protein AB9F46_33800 [Rhizobium leguminosarum]|uniref:hypothetical protein n=1 Tax=Rhizobium leguminosarum TaxID=384 RepID=UPI003F95FCE2
MTASDLFIQWASDRELNQLLAGVHIGLPEPLSNAYWRQNESQSVGVIFKAPDGDIDLIQPLALVVSDDRKGRLFGRFATAREELSPLSSWCHILSDQHFGLLDDVTRGPSLHGLEGAWTGLVIAEAVMRGRRKADNVPISACFATSSFAVARSHAVWPRITLNEVVERYHAANALVRSPASDQIDLTKQLHHIWTHLLRAPDAYGMTDRSLARAIRELKESREASLQESNIVLARALEQWPESELLTKLDRLHPEQRVEAFDHVIAELKINPSTERREVLAFIGAYIATVAAGGAPSISLAEGVGSELPAVLAWAYVIAGLKERITWSSSFAGLGRLVSRELQRPFRIEEAPSCDFAIDEAVQLIDRQLSDPLVHLKVKQQRHVTVALFPGVNMTVSLHNAATQGSASNKTNAATQTAVTPVRATEYGNELGAMVDLLWPHILKRLRSEQLIQTTPKSVGSKRRPVQGKLGID